MNLWRYIRRLWCTHPIWNFNSVALHVSMRSIPFYLRCDTCSASKLVRGAAIQDVLGPEECATLLAQR